MGFSGGDEFGPDVLPVFWMQILAGHCALRCPLDQDARRCVEQLPAANCFPQIPNTRPAGRGEDFAGLFVKAIKEFE